ncbi:MAG: NADP-specific glutamate dehydrogenase [Myxococcota bacterium]
MSEYVQNLLSQVRAKNPAEPEFHQAVQEVTESLEPVLERHPEYRTAKILERMVEPERVIMFRVPWTDDRGEIHINRGFRIQMNSAIGPYKGGLRFHPSVTLGILKFLAFEQVFKNSLTTLPMGGGKGGSDFDPKGKSNAEVMRFAQSFMSELHRHIGPNVDVPAGDIGVGTREIGYLFGQYKRLRGGEFTGVLTGKGVNWGGSLVRPEATGYGVVYFAEEMLRTRKQSFDGKTVAVSGFGNVAWGAVQKATQLGGKVVTLSGPDGFVYDRNGISGDKIEYMLEMRASARDEVRDFAERFKVEFFPGKRPWGVKVDIALPCATQNELDGNDAKELVKNGCTCVCEGANMPTTLDGVHIFNKASILYAPGKASNAGGVATSGLEMSQNSMRLPWSREEVDQRLREIMNRIHRACVDTAERFGVPGNYVTGANIAGFLKVADAMLDQGLV